MKWFKHYSNAHSDSKLMKVRMKYGADGYALYWLCLEYIVEDIDSDKLNFELEHDAELLSHELKIDSAKVEEIMRYFVNLELFEMDSTTQRITCLKLARVLENSIVKNPQLKAIKDSIKSIPGSSGNIPARLDKTSLDEKRLDNKDTCQTRDARLTGLQEKEDIEEIFTSWKTVMQHPKSLLDAKRKRVIKNALKSYSVADLTKAINGCASTPYNMGQNEGGVVYDSLDLIFRDADHIEKFIRHCDFPPTKLSKSNVRQQNNLDALKGALEE